MSPGSADKGDGRVLTDEGGAVEAELSLGLLGSVVVWRDGHEFAVGPPKQRALLCALALSANESVARDRLVDALWGEYVPLTAGESLYIHVRGLRAVLEPDRAPRSSRLLVSVGAAYKLRLDPRQVDALRFAEQVKRARRLIADAEHAAALALLDETLSLWRGTPLAGVSGSFAEIQRTRFSELRLTALEDRADALLSLGRHIDVVTELSGLAKEFPLRERLRTLLMTALYRYGRQAEALAVFQDARRTLIEQLGVEPGPELRGCHERILRADPELRAPSEAHEFAHPLSPRQLPRDARLFVGRDTELRKLAALVREQESRGQQTLVSISGMAGVGKTALAVHFALRIADRFPDGQLFVNLHGFDGTMAPMQPTDVLAGWLRSLGVDSALIPAQLAQRTVLFRSLLAGKRVLVVLDNAISAEQVRPLLPGAASCLILITSRNRLGGLVAREGASVISLDVLDHPETLDLLQGVVGNERIGEEPDAAAELARLSGGLPLAVRIAGARVAVRDRRSLADTVRELVERIHRLDAFAVQEDDESSAMRPVFSWSYLSLDQPTARMFRLLGLHTGPDITPEIAGALAGTDAHAARHLLDLLVDGHLLEETVHGTYRFHDLVRHYAAELAEEIPEAERTGAIERVLGYYMNAAQSACRVLGPHRTSSPLCLVDHEAPSVVFDTYEQALGWCDTNFSNLMEAIQRASELGHEEFSWNMSLTLWDFFFLRKPWTAWIESHRTALAAARRKENRRAEAWVLHNLAFAYRDLRQPERALEHFGEAFRIRTTIGDHEGRSWSLTGLGLTLCDLNRHREAVPILRKALLAFSSLQNRFGENAARIYLGDAYRESGHAAEALECARKSLREFTEIGDQIGVGYSLHAIGEAYREMGMRDAAVAHLEKALARRREAGDRWGEGVALHSLGDLLCETGHVTRGRELLHRALVIFDLTGDPRSAEIRGLLARVECDESKEAGGLV